MIIADNNSKVCSPYDLLEAAERFDDSKLLGVAYYRIMILGRQAWHKEPRLNKGHIQNLTTGAMRCIERWDVFKEELKSWNFWYSNGPQALLGLVEKNTSVSYDILGKLRCGASSGSSSGAQSMFLATITELEGDLLSYFLPNPS